MTSPSTSRTRPFAVSLAMAFALFSSGMCALIYQTVWLREFRLIFGGAAPAAAAVVAVFMAGLGFGGAWFGAWAERVKFPLKFYAFLEAGVALCAITTPVLLEVAKSLYIKTGGAVALGLGTATVVQLALTVLVLGVPCFLMGGTLPVAMKFAQRENDAHRSDTALFYGINAAGALAGAAIGTFALLPQMGNQSALMSAVLANLVIAIVAGGVSMRTEQRTGVGSALGTVLNRKPEHVQESLAPTWFVLGAAFLSGFTFFVAELVWYRVSTPLLGSTVYGFGLVLCVVLAGIGMGGAVNSWIVSRWQPRLAGFTLVSAAQAIFVLLPYAMGDRLAYAALVLNESLRGFGFASAALGWTIIVSVLAFVPSLLAGIQFPLLVSLLGRGNDGVGRELGRAYFWNTVGSIIGSLLGGFVLIPMLSATHTWVVAAGLIALMSALSFLLGRSDREEAGWMSYASFVGLAACVAMASLCQGPTAAWMQTPIGYGRLPDYPKTSLTLEQWTRTQRCQLVKAFDGRDANVAVVVGGDQHAFLTNGKSDGSALGDAPTQVMFGLVGGLLHPRDLEQCCVVGLGTGSTAGWLAALPTVTRVDAIEIESRGADLAREFSTVNRRAMDNPKVRLIVGDGREVMQTSGRVYDLIASEPSNPYRAGVANLYTQEFYQSVRQRLSEDGVFCQWLQGYETDPATVKLVISTLCAAFDKVEVWTTHGSDLLFVCSPSPKPWDLTLVRKRLGQPVYAEACARLWHTGSAEGVFSRCLSNAICTRLIAIDVADINTDDRNQLEFASAKNMGRNLEEPLLHLFSKAAAQHFDVPAVTGQLDLSRLAYERCDVFIDRADILDVVIRNAGAVADALRAKKQLDAYANVADYATYLSMLGSRQPQTIDEKITFAIATALTADPRAADAATALDQVLPESKPLLTAMRVAVDHDSKTDTRAVCDAITALRRSPWIDERLTGWLRNHLITLSKREAASHPDMARQLYDALITPLEEGYFAETRSIVLTQLSNYLTAQERLQAIDSWGKSFPFTGPELATRFVTYAEIDHPGLASARTDLQRFIDLGGHVPSTMLPVTTMLMGVQPGQEVAMMRAFHKQQTAAVTK